MLSIATLIIALGLLVDDPVVAGDSIKRSLAEGTPRIIAAWLGPTKLANRDHVRYHHEYRRLSSVPASYRYDGRVSA